MKKLLVIILLLPIELCAQQLSHYSQYILNNYILNPALSGIENYTDIKLSVRNQWVGLDGAPKTFYFTLHSPIGKSDLKTTPTSFSVAGINPRGSSYWENYQPSPAHHGIGCYIINDKTGNYSHLTAGVSYAYHIPLNSSLNMAAGISGGIHKVSFNRSKATPVNSADPALGNTNTDMSGLSPDLSAGLWFYSADYFIGISSKQLLPEKIHYTGTTAAYTTVPHFFATAGYRFLLNEEINVLPSVMVKYIAGSPSAPQFDVNVKGQYLDLLWLGASYRHQEGYAAMAGLFISNAFNISYAYEFTSTALSTVSSGTHEILLGFVIGNKYPDSCPKNIW